MKLHYTTTGGRAKRASNYYDNLESANEHRALQNARAERLGIKSRYSVEECDGEGIDKKEIWDCVPNSAKAAA